MAKILLVEDDDHQRLLYREALEDKGHRVVEARDGREALAQVSANRPDAVVLDVNLPGMDGLDVLVRLHDFDRRLPVVLNTAYAAYKHQFVSWIADAYVTKSSNPGELTSAVEDVLAKRQRSQPVRARGGGGFNGGRRP